eukprot:11181265-Lingulodinium_polyedra.AAC.1
MVWRTVRNILNHLDDATDYEIDWGRRVFRTVVLARQRRPRSHGYPRWHPQFQSMLSAQGE